jgi:sigma-E factor negative regulatory protein RseA
MKPDSPSAPLRTSAPAGDLAECLSALADGRADGLAKACAGWRDDADARRTWHAYQLIGDVMRSEDLASPPARDAAFLSRLRERLAEEPVVLAPAAAQPAAVATAVTTVQGRRQPWLMPAAVAAGFVLVAGVLVVTRIGVPGAGEGAALLAGASGAGTGLTLVGQSTGTRQQQAGSTESGVLLRDPRLDEYLRAHASARAGAAVVSPGGTLRRVDAAVPAGAGQ